MRFMAQMASLVLRCGGRHHAASASARDANARRPLSTVRLVLLPDMRFENVEAADKIVVPIIVLRNHERFDPFNKTCAQRAAGVRADESKGAAAQPPRSSSSTPPPWRRS
jgi:hypothetical protein